MAHNTEEESAGTSAVHHMTDTIAQSGEPTQEQIAALAYEYWIERGSPHGSHEEDWERAEQDLRGGHGTLSKSAGV